jgi:hypothetical protein
VVENLNLGSGQVELILTSPVTTAQLAAKQDAILGYTYTTASSGTAIMGPTNLPAFDYNTSTWTSQTGYTEITISGQNGAYSPTITVTSGAIYVVSAEVKFPSSGAVTNYRFGPQNSNGNFTSSDGINSSTWTTISVTHTMASTGFRVMYAYGAAGGASQSSGSILIRNIQVTDAGTPAIVSLSSSLVVGGSCTALSYVTSSDERIKAQVEDINSDECQKMLDTIRPKTYVRTDLADSSRRLGFIAQDVATNIPPEFGNLIGFTSDAEDNQLLGLDYGRLSVVLWACLRKSNTKIQELETRLAALESGA